MEDVDENCKNKLGTVEDNLRDIVQGNRKKNTTIKTSRETTQFKKYLEDDGENRELHDIPPD